MRYARLASALLWLAATLVAADPIAGTWKLNAPKSKYTPGPPPKSATITYEETADGTKRTGESVDAEGKTTSFEYTAKYDAKDYPVTGSDLYDTITLKRIDAHTIEATLKKSGKVVSNARRVVSKDGKLMTLTITGTNPKGEKVHNIAVYDKFSEPNSDTPLRDPQ
ncbi:MAG TPA: hypothetical protein VEU11_02660 [Terriglobales bacterium]|nr:hypothetical protein [Terriglobales bacterium]